MIARPQFLHFFKECYQKFYLTDESNEIEDQLKKAIFKYKNHPSIILIKNKITVTELFAFIEASVFDIEK